MFNFVSSSVMQAAVVILTWVILYKTSVIGIIVGPNQVFRCTNKIPSPREKNLTIRGERPLPSTERMVEIFTHVDSKCYIYWSQVTSKEPEVNMTSNKQYGRELTAATIMGQRFIDKKVDNSCVWYTPNEAILNRSIACQKVNMEKDKCVEIR